MLLIKCLCQHANILTGFYIVQCVSMQHLLVKLKELLGLMGMHIFARDLVKPKVFVKILA